MFLSHRIFIKKRFEYFYLAMAVCLIAVTGVTQVQAAIPGTALSNERDVMRVDLNAGPAVPAPGFQFGGTMLWTLLPSHALGVASSSAIHNLEADDATLVMFTNDLVWEHSIALLEGFHALRIRGGMGAVRLHRKMDAAVAKEKGTEADRKRWAPHISMGLAIDFPVADLMWGRIGIWTGRSLIKETPMTGGFYLAWVFGGQWFGVGD